MQMVYKIFILIVLMIMIIKGCDYFIQNSELDKMSNKEVERYFYKNKNDLQIIVDTCKKYPTIMRIGQDNSKYYLKEVSSKTKKIVEDIQKIVTQLKIDNVQCGRNKQIINNELFSVSFCLYSAGISVSGESQSISYETKKSRKRWEKKEKNNIPWETVFPLPSEGWSIIQTK